MASSKARSAKRPASARNGRSANGRAAKAARSTAAVAATPTSSPRAAQRAAAERAASARADEPQPEPAPEAEAPGTSVGPPLWLQLASLVLAIAGLGISAYETWAHYNGSNHLAGCPTAGHGAFNCTAVITSPQSMVFGFIPVALLGLIFYVAAVPLFSPWSWRMRRREVHLVRLASMVVGMGFVMYLIYAELYQVQEVCEYCTGVHIITFLLFCVTVFSAAIWGLRGASARTGS